MKHLHMRNIVLLTFCFFLAAALLPALKGRLSWLPVSAPASLTGEELSLQLAREENLLEQRRAELSTLLRDYYMGQASEQKTASLIAEVEELRLHVEDMRLELARLEGNP